MSILLKTEDNSYSLFGWGPTNISGSLDALVNNINDLDIFTNIHITNLQSISKHFNIFYLDSNKVYMLYQHYLLNLS
jgi:hypothetical protein